MFNKWQLRTEVRAGEISTVKLPDILKNRGGDYETAFFSEDSSEILERYYTQEEAKAGHQKWVENYTDGGHNDPRPDPREHPEYWTE